MVVITAPGKRPILTTGAKRNSEGEPTAEPKMPAVLDKLVQGHSGDNVLKESTPQQHSDVVDVDETPTAGADTTSPNADASKCGPRQQRQRVIRAPQH